MDDPNNKPETMTVDLYDGIKLDLPKDQAERVIAARDQRTAKYNELESLANARAEAEAQAKREADEAKRMAEAIKAAKEDDAAKMKELASQEHRERLEKLQSRLRDKSLASELSKRDDIVSTARDDVAAMLANQVAIDDSGDLYVVGADGKPASKTLDSLITEWVKDRPHLLKDHTPSGSGADGSAGNKPKPKTVISRADYDAAMQSGGYAAQKMSKLVSEGATVE